MQAAAPSAESSGAPLWEPSAAVEEESSASAPRSSTKRVSWSPGHTPVLVHRAGRRPHVMPEPEPSSRVAQGLFGEPEPDCGVFACAGRWLWRRLLDEHP